MEREGVGTGEAGGGRPGGGSGWPGREKMREECASIEIRVIDHPLFSFLLPPPSSFSLFSLFSLLPPSPSFSLSLSLSLSLFGFGRKRGEKEEKKKRGITRWRQSWNNSHCYSCSSHLASLPSFSSRAILPLRGFYPSPLSLSFHPH